MIEFSIIWLGFMGLLAWAAATDVAALRIPNAAVAGLVGLYVVAVAVAGFPTGWYWGPVVGLAVLALGIVMFMFKVAGAGDGKLLAAVALWAGPDQVIYLLGLTALLGLAIVPIKYLAMMAFTQVQLRVPNAETWTMPRGLAKVKSVPYGVAIAGAAVITSLNYPSWIWAF